MKTLHLIYVRTAVLSALLVAGVSRATVEPQPSSDARKAFDAAPFQRVDEFESLPPSVQSNLMGHFASREPPSQSVFIANPGQRFNAGDALLPGPPLPMRRLVFGGVGPGISFVYYEHGGIGHHYHLTIYQDPIPEPTLAARFTRGIKRGKPREVPTTIEALKLWLRTGEMTNDAIENRDW